ncbi:MAG: tetratricopeptide repeat protein [Planctomycetes bacterium]|nr:tetratricopeptide repeat protein [Planctomycetota bacterium]
MIATLLKNAPRAALVAALAAGCAAPAPAARDVARATVDDDGRARDDLSRALREHDTAALERIVVGPGDARARALAAHALGELLRLAATLAERRDDEAALERVTARRLEVARRGLDAADAALAGRGEDVALLVARGELRAYLIDGWRAGLVHGGRARRDLAAALAFAPRDPDARLAWAKQFYYLPPACGGDLVEAARLIEGIVADAPEHAPSWGFLGQVYQALERPADARAALERALSLDPRSPRGRAFLLGAEVLP